MFSCYEVAASNGDKGLARHDHIEGLDEKVYRHEPNGGGMEWAHRREFEAMGWRARTYFSLLDPCKFYIRKRAKRAA
jgi:hypothetical protein